MKIKKRSIDKTKRLFKFAITKQPESITSLRRSLSISNANIQAFANNIGEYTSERILNDSKLNKHTSKSVIVENSFDSYPDKQTNNLAHFRASRKQIVKQRNKNKVTDESNHSQARKKIVSKSFKLSQLSLQSRIDGRVKTLHQRAPLHCSQYEFVLPRSNQQSMRNTKRQYWNINQPKNRPFGATKYKKVVEQPKENEKNESNRQNFQYFSKSSNPAKLNRPKTQPNEKPGQKSVCYLTNYDSSRNNKAFHYLVLQLQLNLEIQKKVKSKTQA